MHSRILKPGFFLNEDLAACEPLARILFAGLWCAADREGLLEDRPARLKPQILPHDNVGVDALLDELQGRGFIRRYEVDGKRCIQVIAFKQHQHIHPREAKSVLPPPPGNYRELPGAFGKLPEKVPAFTLTSTSTFTPASAFAEEQQDHLDSQQKAEDGPAFLSFPCAEGGTWGLTAAKLDEYRRHFPDLDVLAKLLAARSWCLNNEPKRKAPDEMPAFLASWLIDAQNQAAAKRGKEPPAEPTATRLARSQADQLRRRREKEQAEAAAKADRERTPIRLGSRRNGTEGTDQ